MRPGRRRASPAGSRPGGGRYVGGGRDRRRPVPTLRRRGVAPRAIACRIAARRRRRVSRDRDHHRPVPTSRRRGVPLGGRRRPSPAGSRSGVVRPPTPRRDAGAVPCESGDRYWRAARTSAKMPALIASGRAGLLPGYPAAHIVPDRTGTRKRPPVRWPCVRCRFPFVYAARRGRRHAATAPTPSSKDQFMLDLLIAARDPTRIKGALAVRAAKC
jgi:hypothetical protein